MMMYRGVILPNPEFWNGVSSVSNKIVRTPQLPAVSWVRLSRIAFALFLGLRHARHDLEVVGEVVITLSAGTMRTIVRAENRSRSAPS
jgi:hypothetical protein